MAEYEIILAKLDAVPAAERGDALQECVRLLDNAQCALIQASDEYRAIHGFPVDERQLWREALWFKPV